MISLAVSAIALTLTAIPGAAHADPGPPSTYIVQLAGEPVAATKPENQPRLDIGSAAAKERGKQLAKDRKRALKMVPGVKKLYDYEHTFHGFAAKMTPREAATLSTDPKVRAVVKDEIRHVTTSSTPTFLGLSGSDGAWVKQFGDPDHAGEGVIIGIVDTGISYDSPSFAALPEPRPDQAIINAKWRGSCDKGMTCNNKVIGGRWYLSGTATPEDYRSPRDYDGHGSHTASTAAGNHDVTAIVNGQPVGKVSGMAPGARVAAYKVCWTGGGGGECSTADSMAAIDQATADGVDVINFSIGGTTTTTIDPVSIAFYNAARAGVFVAASAGNSGENGASTSEHNAPWITTVAASTHDRLWQATVTLGNGVAYTGAGLGAAIPRAPLVSSATVARSGADASQVNLCFPNTLDPDNTKGKIIVCDRGVNERIEKSRVVQQAGGVGMLLLNPSHDSVNADFHSVPTIHLDHVAGATVREYLGKPDPSASFTAGTTTVGEAPEMAAFSSRGPGLVSHGDLLKPDITAPGMDVLAAVAPVTSNGNGYGTMSGTSMSSPHVAGIGALLKSKHPKWGPMAVKSALMTTAGQMDNQGKPIQRDGAAADPFDFGAGHVQPPAAFDPGLVYESTYNDWNRFICGTEDARKYDCNGVPHREPSNLNYPSIAVGDLLGVQTVTRQVTNVTDKDAVYHLDIQPPPGFSVEATPTELAVPAGGHADFTVTFTRSTAEFDKFQFGSLTWSDQMGHRVRSPLAVRAAQVTAPAEIFAASTEGSRTFDVDTGFSGTLTASVSGLVAADIGSLALKNPTASRFDPANPKPSDHTGKVEVTVPEGTKLARFATYNADYPKGTDLDLFVYLKTPTGLVPAGSSAGPDADESVMVTMPKPGTYEIYVDLYTLPAGQKEISAKYYSWVLSGPAHNVAVSPESQQARPGGRVTVGLTWWALKSDSHYLGLISYGDGKHPIGGTTFRVDP